ncbi:organic solute transporter subunit alpha-like isoform X1 [Schistocerca cancellata]|uniref:organic solute transporter subunit alpha-like isoform X1 n=1 Tax=Schistocerca cancellata TaxID=274614 RepID=UPI002118EBEE|nr:organic solute transporter subunit alpha-like isoform X1 [Schistocerca cancellata]
MVTEFSSVFSVFSSTQGGRLETGEGCAHSQLPTVEEFYSNLTPLLSVAIAVSTAAVVSVCVTYTLSLRHVLTRTAPQLRSHTAWVLTIHPVAAVLAYLSVMIPRASFLVDVGIQDLYATCLYQMFCLLVAYCEQEGSTDQLHGAMIQLNTGPLCCLPGCHWFCRPVPLTRKTLLQLRILVLQLPIAMWILYTVCYVLWAEDERLLDRVWPYLEPLKVGSVLVAGWGTQMVVQLLARLRLPGGGDASHKFLALELTMLAAELQGAAADSVAALFPCSGAFSPSFWSRMGANVLTLLELVALSLWANRLYCTDAAPFDHLEEEQEPNQLGVASGEATSA